ncbi:hypothetical protein HGRIS_014694 [Hohenbuehelia grisea]|uniref:Uncharacterized protein n=1 Tax=Hohenbuehelia grisea TaxID=104357 RepID=A0ABR3JU77_9AGAR
MQDIIEKILIPCSLDGTHTLPNDEPLELQRVRPTAYSAADGAAPSRPQSITYHFTQLEVVPIHMGEFTSVYQTHLRIEGFPSFTVVLKTDVHTKERRPKQFRREAAVYENDLRRYQGGYIPRCYGLFQGVVDEDIYSVLVLEYAGEPIHYSAHEFSPDFKIDVINKLATLHRHGFQHGDLDDRNILNNKGKAIFIDLESVQSHECDLKQALILDDLQPSIDQFGCDEIYETAFMLGFWQRLCVDFQGCPVYLSAIQPGRAENLVERIRYKLWSNEDREQALEEARRLIDEIESWRAWYKCLKAQDRLLPPSNAAHSQQNAPEAVTTV